MGGCVVAVQLYQGRGGVYCCCQLLTGAAMENGGRKLFLVTQGLGVKARGAGCSQGSSR